MDKVTIGNWRDFDETLRYKYDLKPTDKVLDIGSYRREWCDKIIQMYGCEVECFDALDNRAAWTYEGKIAMGGNFLYTSMYSENIDKEFFCVDIANYLQNEIALVKMNIEGGEYELLKYIYEKGLMKNIKNLQVQFHMIEGMSNGKLYKGIADMLRITHQPTWRRPFVWENWERL